MWKKHSRLILAVSTLSVILGGLACSQADERKYSRVHEQTQPEEIQVEVVLKEKNEVKSASQAPQAAETSLDQLSVAAQPTMSMQNCDIAPSAGCPAPTQSYAQQTYPNAMGQARAGYAAPMAGGVAAGGMVGGVAAGGMVGGPIGAGLAGGIGGPIGPGIGAGLAGAIGGPIGPGIGAGFAGIGGPIGPGLGGPWDGFGPGLGGPWGFPFYGPGFPFIVDDIILEDDTDHRRRDWEDDDEDGPNDDDL